MLTLEAARALLASHRPRCARHGYPQQVREQVIQVILVELDVGRSATQLGQELGIAPATVRRWTRITADTALPDPVDHATFLPLQVSTGVSKAFTLTTPAGHELHGLDLPSAIAVLRALG